MVRKFTARAKQFLIYRLIEEANAGRLSKHNYAQLLKNDQLEVMGVEASKEALSHLDQQIQSVFYQRQKIAFELGQTLRLIRSEVVPVVFSMEGNGPDKNIFVNRIVVTWLGGAYGRLPSFAQVSLLWLATSSLRFAGTLTKFKWLTGLISFVVLAAKVWHSGAIDKAWIGISAAAGLGAVWLLSMWR